MMAFASTASPLAAPYVAPPAFRVVTELGYFLGLFAVIGFACSYLFVVRPALSATGRDAVRARAGALFGGAAVLLVVTAYLQLAARLARAGTHPPGFGRSLLPAAVWGYLRTPGARDDWISTGALIGVQSGLVVVTALLLGTFALSRGRADRLIAPALAGGVLVAVLPSVPTSIAGWAWDDTVQAVLVQAHILGGAVWLGGLALLVGLAIAARRPDAVSAGTGFAVMWQRFSTLAMIAVGSIVLSGLWLAWKHVGSISQLWTTPYGRFLLVKLALVAVLVAAGGYNQFVLTPRIAQARALDNQQGVFRLALHHFPTVVVGELLAGVGVLVIVPFLAGSARSEAGQKGTPTFDTGILVLGLLLIAMLAASVVTSLRVSTLVCRDQARSATDVPDFAH